MKTLLLLKFLVQVMVVLSIAIIFFAVPFVLITIVMPGTIPFKINGLSATEIPLLQKILALITVLGSCCFIYALILFKQVLVLFEKKKMFYDDVITSFAKTGKFILLGYAIVAGCKLLLAMMNTNSRLTINFVLHSIIAIGIGLFFVVLSHIFRIAKALKEENTTTV